MILPRFYGIIYMDSFMYTLERYNDIFADTLGEFALVSG